jgi:hypothetical protein
MLGVFASRTDLQLLFSDARLVDDRGDHLGLNLFEALEITPGALASVRDGRAFGTLLRRNLVTGATVVFRRELMDLAAPFPALWLHDEWLAILAAAGGGIDWMPDRLIDYRQHGANEVGVAAPTVLYKIRRMFEPRGDRVAGLALRTDALVNRLRAMDQPGVELAERKLLLESARARLPRARVLRIVPILKAARGGAYARFASRGRADMLRDLLQGA